MRKLFTMVVVLILLISAALMASSTVEAKADSSFRLNIPSIHSALALIRSFIRTDASTVVSPVPTPALPTGAVSGRPPQETVVALPVNGSLGATKLPTSTTTLLELLKTWHLRNSGIYTSGTSYQPAFIGGDQMGAPDNVSLPRNVALDAEVDFFEERPLHINKPVYSMSISGDIVFDSRKSLLRVILLDNNQAEYLVYESYPLISTSNSFTIDRACQETCVLDGVVPAIIRIEGYDTRFDIKSILFSDSLSDLNLPGGKAGMAAERVRIAGEQESSKIQILNEQINKKGMKWIAGENAISRMTYAQKKRLFRKPDGTPVNMLPNLQGFEYYSGGIFETESDHPTQTSLASSGFRSSWDWRKVHGENWMTSVKDQNPAATCWAFATVGSIEAQINLNYNQHLDKDLSEQMYVDCINSSTPIWGMNPYIYPECSGDNLCYPGYQLCVPSLHGIVDEACDPYVARYDSSSYCDSNHVCSDWRNRVWRFNDFWDFKFTDSYGTPMCPYQTMNTTAIPSPIIGQ